MKFKYTALTNDNQKATGVLEADSLALAKEELHRLELSILAVDEVSEQEFAAIKSGEEAQRKASHILTFYFRGIDSEGKSVEGTIDAAQAYEAYRRLISEYHFILQSLYESGADDAQKKAMELKLPQFAEMLKGEAVATPQDTRRNELEIDAGAVDQKVIAEIDRIIINSKKVLESHRSLFSPEQLRQIEETLGQIERIRSSNNLKHISEVCSQLFELVSHPDNRTVASPDKDYDTLVREISDSAVVGSRSDALGSQASAGISKINAEISAMARRAPAGQNLSKPSFFSRWFAKKAVPGSLPEMPKPKAPDGRFAAFWAKLIAYFTAPNPILRKIRKQELKLAWAALISPEKAALAGKSLSLVEEMRSYASRAKRQSDFTHFFQECDGFVSWMLAFYMVYFFLVSFSLEKGIGLKQEFIYKTLQNPLIVNVCILLFLLHASLKLKTSFFRRNVLGSLSLFVFTGLVYAFLMFNF